VFFLTSSAAVWSAEDASTLEAFHAAKAKWDAANLDSYTFVVSYWCYCFSQDIGVPALVRVRKERIRSATYTKVVRAHPDGRVPRINPLRITIPDLFRMIEDAHHSDFELVMAKYDETLGYPLELVIDQGRGELTDMDVRYEVTRLKRSP
jgi:hypothetical protein